MSYVNDVDNFEVIVEYVKQIAGKLLKGQISNLINIPKPIQLSAPHTLIHALA